MYIIETEPATLIAYIDGVCVDHLRVVFIIQKLVHDVQVPLDLVEEGVVLCLKKSWELILYLFYLFLVKYALV